MPVYKDYIIKQGDTIESIAQKYLGSASRAPELVSLNRLRPPYIAATSSDFLGIPKVSVALQDTITKGSTSFDASKYIESNLISPLILTEKALFYIKSNMPNGSYIEDTMSIKTFYPNAAASQNIKKNTIVFDTAVINPPSNPAESNNLLSKFYQFTITASISGTILTVHSISSGFISVGMQITGELIPANMIISAFGTGQGGVGTYVLNTSHSTSYQTLSGKIPANISLQERKYFVQYTYNSINGETIASPLNINKINGAAIPFIVEPKYLLSVEPPTAWPTAATSVNIYIGTSPTSVRYQGTLSSINSMLVEPVNGFSFAGKSVPSANTAHVGFDHTYQPGTIFSIHTNPAQFGTQVLGVGDLMHLPSENTVAIASLFNNKNPNKFFSALGVDIALNETGHISFNDAESGDFLTVSGRDNIKQAIQSLLNTRLNLLKTRPNYGNSALNLIGEKFSTTFFQRLRSDIVRAISRDRRIYSIKSLEISYDRNTSSVNITNLSVQTSSDGSSASVVTFLPIALPI